MRPDPAGDRCEAVAEVAGELLSARVTIRPARSDDLAALIEIERAAGEMFRSVGMDLVADDDPGSAGELLAYAEGGRAFVAVDASERQVGYVIFDIVDGAAHIEQVSVHPDCARRGIGRALIVRTASWVRERGLAGLTLTTYVGVPWNGHYYERLGFCYLASEDERPGVQAIRLRERARGLNACHGLACAATSRRDAWAAEQAAWWACSGKAGLEEFGPAQLAASPATVAGIPSQDPIGESLPPSTAQPKT
jgi:ribosomal protein S18 acetylase RimI-like enzyme